MPAKLPDNKWSWRFDRCFLCGTNSKEGRFAHESKGLCFYCYKKISLMKHKKGIIRPKKWYKNYWEKVRNDPVARKRYQDHCRQWRKNSPVFKAYLKKRNKKLKYARFIKDWFENRSKFWQKRHQGITINFEHDGRIYKIKTPLKQIIGKERELDLFEGQLRKYLNQRP